MMFYARFRYVYADARVMRHAARCGSRRRRGIDTYFTRLFDEL